MGPRAVLVGVVVGCSGSIASAQALMYGLAGNVNPVLRQLNPTTGAIIGSQVVTGHEALFGGLAAAGGGLYSIDGYNDPNPDRLFRIDSSSGAGTVVGSIGFNWNFRMLHVHPGTGVLYGARDNALFTLDTATGLATHVANITAPGLGQITAMAINSAGQAYVTNISGVTLFSLDLSTGNATALGDLGGPSNWFNDLAFDPSGVLYGARTQGGVYTIDTVNVIQTFAFPGNYTGLTFLTPGVTCYANCDQSTQPPVLNVADFTCFLQKFAAGDAYANCDESTQPPVLNVADFTCFLQKFAAGCR